MEQLDNLPLIIYIIEVLCGTAFKFILCMTAMILLAIAFIKPIYMQQLKDNMEYYSEGSGNYRRYEISYNNAKKFGFKRFLISGLLAAMINILIPNKTTAYTILASYVGVEVLTAPQAQEIGGKSLDVINKVLDDYLEEETKD